MSGLCLLLLGAPFGTMRWLRTTRTDVADGHLFWLVLALGWAIGILTCGGGSAGAGCTSEASLLALVFWTAEK